MSLDSFLRIFGDVYTVPFWNGQEGKIFVDVERGEWIEETSGGSGAQGIENWARNPQYQFRWEPDSDSSHEVLKVFLYVVFEREAREFQSFYFFMFQLYRSNYENITRISHS